MSDKNFKIKNGIDANGASSIASSSVSDTTLSINSISGQYGLIQAWNVVGSTVVQVDGNGHFYTLNGRGVFVNSGWIASTRFAVIPWETSSIGMIIKGLPSQTGDLTQWQNSDGTVLAKIDSSGSITAADLTLSGNLTVNGTTTNLNSTNLIIEDKNIIIADVATPTDTTADGAGITIKGATDKTFNWVQSTGSFTSSEPLIISSNAANNITVFTAKDANNNKVTVNSDAVNRTSITAQSNSSATAHAGAYFTADGFEESWFNINTRSNTAGQKYMRFGNLGNKFLVQRLNDAATSITSTPFTIENTSTTNSLYINSTGAIINGATALGQLTVYSASASTIGMVIRGAASQTANLQEWQASDGTVYGRFNAFGSLYVSNNTEGGTAQFGNTGFASASSVVLKVKGSASQTANLQEWQDSSATVLASINASGNLILGTQYISNSGASAYGRLQLLDGGTNQTILYPASAGLLIANAGVTTMTVVKIRGAASQTADLQQWQNSSGTVLVKIDSTGQITSLGSDHYFSSSAAYRPNIHIRNTTADSNGSYILFEKSRAGSAVVANDVLGVLNFTGFETTTYAGSAIIYGVAEGTFSPTSRPGKLVFATVPSGSTTMTDRMTIANSGTVTINGFGAAAQGLIIKSAASQSVNIFEVQNSGGYPMVYVDAYGALVARASGMYVDSGYSSGIGLQVRGVASQTANLQEWQNSSGTVLASINKDGSLSNGNVTTTTLYTQSVNSGSLSFSGIAYNGFSNPSGVTTLPTLVIKGIASQTANLQEWQNSAGTVLTKIGSNGQVFINPSSASVTALTVKSSPTYPANLQEWQDSSGTILAQFRYNGSLDLYTISPFGNSGTYMDFTSSSINMNSRSTTTTSFVVKGAASQTANLQEWQNSSGTVLGCIASDGNLNFFSKIIYANQLYVGTGNYLSATMHNISGGAGEMRLLLRAHGSQTASIQEWQNNSGTALAKVDASGNITAPSYNLSDSKYLLRKTIKKTVDPAQNAVANNTYDLFDMNFSSSLQGTFYIQASIRGGGYGQNLTYSLPATYVMDWINLYPITNPFTNSTTWVDLTPLTFSPRHLMTNDYFKLQAKVNANQISFRIKLTGTLTGAPVFDIYIQHSEEFANSTITELNTTGTDATTSNVMPNFLSSKAGLSAIFNPITLYSNSASTTPLAIRGAASQTANLFETQDSSGNALVSLLATANSTNTLRFTDNFAFGINWGNNPVLYTAPSPNTLIASPYSAARIGFIVKGLASQTADLQQWQNSAGTTMFSVQSDGSFKFSDALTGPGVIYWGGVNIGGFGGGAGLGNTWNFTPYNSSRIAVIVRGASSQTADLQQWQNSAGTILTRIASDGSIYRGATTIDSYGAIYTTETMAIGANAGQRFASGGMTIINRESASAVIFGVKGLASQTGDLTQWRNSSDTVLAKIDKDGVYSSLYGANLATTNVSPVAGISLFVGGQSGAVANTILKNSSGATYDFIRFQDYSGTTLAKLDYLGNFSAVSKSFDIEHPTKDNMRLRYASLEGPENGVYIRGTTKSNIIELPEYWTGLVHEDSITVSLTAVGSAQNIYVEKIENNKVYIGGELTKAFFTVYGERKDIDNLVVEY